MYHVHYTSPIGVFSLLGNDTHLQALLFEAVDTPSLASNYILQETQRQLDFYFARKLKQFQIPLDPQGTLFQVSVWHSLQDIGYGETLSYKQLAARRKEPLAIRAIANANGRNPIPILIPCHRVVGSRGEWVGFSGGLWRKQYLLELEQGSLFA
ncbi:MAG: hypothetical protein RIQ62_1215 [Bacteroidota bacterium]|jgi:O-6-methylguanine DNA methyltransferase